MLECRWVEPNPPKGPGSGRAKLRFLDCMELYDI